VVRLGDGNPQGLSPDGKWALSVVPSSPMRLVLYPIGAGEPRSLENGGIENYDSAAFFGDGKRVLACGNEAGQSTRCYVQDLAGGRPRAVTPPGTSRGLISPDGTAILARASDGKFLIYPVTGGQPRPVVGADPNDSVIRWSRSGESILVYRRGEVPARIERLELSTGRRTLVRKLAPGSRAGVVGVRYVTFADDEQSYAYTYTRFQCRLSSVTGVK
jgi:Tol biopolymer transport system component